VRWRSVLTTSVGLVATLAVAASACGGGGDVAAEPSPSVAGPTVAPTSVLSILTRSGEPATLRVAVADDEAERARGLMGVASLPEDHGMAFVWDDPTQGAFWMKDTLIPLSVAFWDEDGRIVGIVDMEPCAAEPCPTYSSPGPYVGAVEANRGWFASRGVEVGDVVELRVGADA